MSAAVGIAYVDGPRLRNTLLAACTHAQRQRGELNRINVFPVPDGDTGTNLSLTVRAIAERLGRVHAPEVGVVAREAAEAAVLGARGNCGMMLSHFLLGFAGALDQHERVSPAQLAAGLRAGVSQLADAIDRPVEGTILTVMRETATAAEERSHRDFVVFVEHVTERARAALARTPQLLPVLAAAGVVDAGAKGFVSLLEGVLLFIHGDPLVAPPEPPAPPVRAAVADVAMDSSTERFRFCTEALVRGPGIPDRASVQQALRARGDSLLVIRSGPVLKVHIHTDDPEAVFAYLRSLGTLATHKAEDMHAQHAAVGRAADRHVTMARRPLAVVTDSACDLPEEVLQAHGIHMAPLSLIEPDGTVLRDRLDIAASAFHARLAAGGDGELPTTSQPSPAAFLEAFRAAAEEGEEVIAVMLGSSLSGTYGSAAAAAAMFEDAPIHLVDTLAASLLEGLMVLWAAELAELATPAAEIVRRLGEARRRSGILLTVDRFDRLLASGRVGKGRALMGSLLRVKPILELDVEGRVQPVGKVLGRRRVRTAMLQALAERVPADGTRVRFGVPHVCCPDVVPAVSEQLRRRYGPEVEVISAPATPVIATHLGPGAWGVAYLVQS